MIYAAAMSLAEQLRTMADADDSPAGEAHRTIIDCHTGYHTCPDPMQRELHVFEYECPTLLALCGLYGVDASLGH